MVGLLVILAGQSTGICLAAAVACAAPGELMNHCPKAVRVPQAHSASVVIVQIGIAKTSLWWALSLLRAVDLQSWRVFRFFFSP